MVLKFVISRHVREVLVESRRLGEWDEDDPELVHAILQKVIDNLEFVTRDG